MLGDTGDHQSRECTLYLVQRQHEVLLCRYVLQHDGQLSFVLHGGVQAALQLHRPPAPTRLRRFLLRGHKEDKANVPTLGCSAYHSSIWESNSQESKVSSTSPRKLLCPNRSWCHTETCNVRVSSCEWLITYWSTQKVHNGG